MLKTVLVASLAAGALALPAPAALAGHATYDCGFDAVAQETLTGDTYMGVLYGYASSPNPGERVTLRCYIAVDGTDVASAPQVLDTPSLVVVAGAVTYVAGDTQTVQVCAEWSAGSESGAECYDSAKSVLPPPEIIGLADAVLDVLEEFYPRLIDCWVLATVGATGLADVPGVLSVNAQGDVFLLGEPFWDCPPYDLWG